MGNQMMLTGPRAGLMASEGRRRVITLLLMCAVAVMSLFAGTMVPAHADDSAQKIISTEAYGNVSSKDYELDGGGTVKGRSLLVKNEGGVYDVNRSEYDKLSSKGRDQFVSDIIASTNESVKNGSKTGVNQDTQTDWLRTLQKNPGFGTKVLNETMKNTGPDFATANRIYQPFSGLVGTILALGAILIMALLGLVIVSDIAYITIPPFRLLTGDADSGVGKAASKIVTSEALRAVQEAEGGGNGGDGGNKIALLSYFKARVISMIVLGLCLVYLIQGQIWVAIGWLLDALNGFIGV